jgi:hypothetical protein
MGSKAETLVFGIEKETEDKITAEAIGIHVR